MNRARNKLIGALCVNALIVILEVIALILSLTDQGLESFLFYTQDSNYLAMAISLVFCVYAWKELHRKGEIPNWIHSVRYVSVSCLMLTFFVVLFVLMPMMGENAFFMLYGGSMLYQHTLCPVLAVFSFFVFERKKRLQKADLIKALTPTLVYAIVAIALNICGMIEGPYFFLMVYTQPWYMSVIWCAVVLGIAGVLAFVVWKLHNFLCTE